MNTPSEQFCIELVGGLIVPALLSLDMKVVFSNNECKRLFPSALPGASMLELFPEAAPAAEFPKKSFDVPAFDGTVSVSVSPFMEFELWQFTVKSESDPALIEIGTLSKNSVSMMLSEVNLLQNRCPEQKELCSAIYRNCCRLMKYVSAISKRNASPILSVTNLSSALSDFVKKHFEVLSRLSITLICSEIRTNVFISADAWLLENILSGAVCLALYNSGTNGRISLSLGENSGRAIVTVTPQGSPTSDTLLGAETLLYSNSDRILTEELLKSNLEEMSATLYTVSDGSSDSFMLSFPLADNRDLLTESPIQPSSGIPAYLIQLSSILPTEFYSHLS